MRKKESVKNALTAILFLCAVCLLLAAAFTWNGKTAAAQEEPKKVVYSDFSALPSDWKAYEKSDTYEGNTTVNNSDGTMTVRSVNAAGGHFTSNQVYYGLTYLLGEEEWGDFTFTLTFKMTDAENDRRWLGVVYHTNFNAEGNMAGYIMNYRYNGVSASSVVTYAKSFHDDAEGGGDPLSDGEYHTLKIVMKGTTAFHYMDGSLIKMYDTTTKRGGLGGSDLTKGGFALIVNGSRVTIKEVTVKGEAEQTDTTLVNTYRAVTGLVNAPTVVARVNDKDDLDKLQKAAASSENERPTNAILLFNENQKIVGEDGTVLGDFSEIYDSLCHNVIPVLYVADTPSANALIDYLTGEKDILDLAVMSDDAALIKAVRSAKTSIRGALLCGETENIYDDIIVKANSNYANVVVLPESMATTDIVSYIQKRFKTVWTTVEGESDLDYYRGINCGAYGIVVENFTKAYAILETYPEDSLSRTPFVVGHRGTPQTKNQNSVSGLLNAAQANISHVEFDVYLTADKEVVLMHNRTLDETTNVDSVGGAESGKDIETLTLEQIRKYQLDQYGMEEIPVLGDILKELVKTDLVFILEIKSTQKEIVSRIKDQLDEYGCYDQVVIISFSLNTLREVKNVMPQVPTAYLGSASVAGFANDLVWLGNCNTNVDMNYGGASKELNEMLRDRGFIGWYWTYGTTSAIKQAEMEGFTGLTADAAEAYVNHLEERYLNPQRLTGGTDNKIEQGKALSVGDPVSLTLVMYNGTTRQVEGTVTALKETEDGYQVVASYAFESAYYKEILHTDVFFISKENKQGGCGSAMEINGLAMIAAVCVMGIVGSAVCFSKKSKN